MEVVNGVIVAFDSIDKNLIIPKDVVGMDYAVADLAGVEGFDSITVEDGNEHFYMQDGCLIWRDKKALMLAVKDAKIPDDGSVTQIAGGAFMYREELKEIEVPSSIEKINYEAFAQTGLEKVTLNEGLEILDAYAFGFNDNLKELAIPKSVKKIVKYKILEQVDLMTEHGYKNKTYIVYKNSYAHGWVKRNGLKFKFAQEKYMKKNGIYYWFNDGKYELLDVQGGVMELRIPAFMNKVSGEFFWLCLSLEKISVEKGNQKYYATGNCLMSKNGDLVAGLKNSVIPTDGSVKRIGHMAFRYEKAPTHLIIPDGVQSIGYCAFGESSELRSVYIPESVTEMCDSFEGSENLTSVFFGGSREQWENMIKGQQLNPHGVEPRVYCKTEGAGMRQMNIEERHVCPVCGKTMFPEYDSHDICKVCGWKDYAIQEKYTDKLLEKNGCTLAEYRAKYEKIVHSSKFDSWKRLVEVWGAYKQLGEKENARLQAELEIIKKTDSAAFFQAIFDSCNDLALCAGGQHRHLIGEAEKWYIFHVLALTRINPIESAPPKSALSKVSIVVSKKLKRAMKKFVSERLPANTFEIIEE